MPIDALVSPFPRELTTPPVTNRCLVTSEFLPEDRMTFRGRLPASTDVRLNQCAPNGSNGVASFEQNTRVRVVIP